MAQTQEQWYEKLKSWVPSWWFTQDLHYNRAVFMGLAKVFAQLELDRESHFNETFIVQSTDPVVYAHGDERGVEQLTSETLDSYKLRIRDFKNTTDLASLQAKIDAVLPDAVALIIENWQHGFFDDDYFYGANEARWLSKTRFYNWLTIIVPEQPSGDIADIRLQLVEIVDHGKALGILVDILSE